MYIVISGGGDVGFHLAQILSREGHDVAIIERDPNALERLKSIDALVIKGHGGSPKKLEEAYIDYADVFIGVTGSDETNIIGCTLAKEHGCKTIARIKSEDYINEPMSLNLTHLGIDIAISPELISAIRIARILTMPTLYEMESFAGGKIRVLETVVKEDSFVAGKSIKRSHLPAGTNVVAIYRNDDIIIPFGKDLFLPGDRVALIIGDLRVIPDLQDIFGKLKKFSTEEESGEIRKVMIYGATDLGIRLAKVLAREKMGIILIEDDRERCERIAEDMPSNVLVINGSGTERETLIEEGVDVVDAFIALTPSEERNVLSCLVAKQYGARKTVALIGNIERKGMIEEIGVDLAINTKLSTVSTVLSHVHREEIKSLGILYRGEAIMADIQIPKGSKVIGNTLSKLRLKKGIMIGAIVRKGRVIIPHGTDTLHEGDRAIIFFKTEMMRKVEKLIFK